VHRFGLNIVDTHVHPFDVMGIVHPEDYPCPGKRKSLVPKAVHEHLKPTLVERMEAGRLVNALVNITSRLFPWVVVSEIRSMYGATGEQRLLDEMECARVDSAVLAPVEPWVSSVHIKRHFPDSRFLLLGSIDLHASDLDGIHMQLVRLVNELHVVGIKLHPNLQGFKPQPQDNPRELAEKLRLLYKTAEEHKLYLLFHGGKTNVIRYVDRRYGNHPRSGSNGLLKNFCSETGEGEVFSAYRTPKIIAHLGHYGLDRLDCSLIRKIADRHEDVFFDTSGVSPGSIKKMIELVGSRRLIWGSDALYNRMRYSMFFVYKAALSARTHENPDDIMMNILGRNYHSSVLTPKDAVI